MTIHTQIDHAYQTFLEQLQKVRVVLLHPDSRYRSVVVARLINTSDIPTFYYALGPDDIDVQAFIMGLTHDIANQWPTFGRHTNMIPDAVFLEFPANEREILETFARDLAEISDKPFLLVLDEYDRSDSADDVQRFVEKLVDYMPPQCTLVINSRTLPRLPWVSFIACNRAAMLQDSKLIRENHYGLVNDDDGRLEIYALGPGFVLMDNQYIDAWEGHLPRLLLYFALDRPVVTRSDICRAFWPELNAEQAVNVFHVTKRRLHKALDLDVLVHENGYYQVNPALSTYYDVLEFVKVLMAGRDEQNPNRIEAWQRAIDLYRGPFLQGHTDPWIEERRLDFRKGYIEALKHMAAVWEGRNRSEPALDLFRRALVEDQHNASLHLEVMRLYVKLGRRSEAIAHCQTYMHVLTAQGKTLPEALQRMYQELLA